MNAPATEPVEDGAARLRGLLEALASQSPAREDEDGAPWAYRSVFEMVLDLGAVFTGGYTVVTRPNLGDVRRGVAPFQHVWTHAQEHHMVYVEGFALWAGEPLPRRHAWVSPVGDDGAVELVRSRLADAYLGIRFAPDAFIREGLGPKGALTLWSCRAGMVRLDQQPVQSTTRP